MYNDKPADNTITIQSDECLDLNNKDTVSVNEGTVKLESFSCNVDDVVEQIENITCFIPETEISSQNGTETVLHKSSEKIEHNAHFLGIQQEDFITVVPKIECDFSSNEF